VRQRRYERLGHPTEERGGEEGQRERARARGGGWRGGEEEEEEKRRGRSILVLSCRSFVFISPKARERLFWIVVED